MRPKPDIRVITRLVPPNGNLVQGQSELPIDTNLAEAAARIIAASQNHYGPSEGISELRNAVAEKIALFNGIKIDVDAKPFELVITHGGTGALVAIAQNYLRGYSALVFEPYYPYHRRIIEENGGVTEAIQLRGDNLEFDKDELRARCIALKDRSDFPLRAIIVCSPANPTGKVLRQDELDAIADVCKELNLLCIADEVYEHYVVGEHPHVSIATLPDMWERTLTVNSFSKSWNISGWRLGYAYGKGKFLAPVNNTVNVAYVCSPTPLQRALASVLMADPQYYSRLHDSFIQKHAKVVNALNELGFTVYDSGSAFYIWARIPEGFGDAGTLNERLIKEAGVAGVPGNAFADSEDWDCYMRLCIAREESVLNSSIEKLRGFLTTDNESLQKSLEVSASSELRL
jgi:aminotransferase